MPPCHVQSPNRVDCGYKLGRFAPSDVKDADAIDYYERTCFPARRFAVAAAVISLLPSVMFAQPANNSASGNATMKAVRLHDFGAPEVLQYEDAPRPQPKGDELLLRVIATAVNPVDAKIARAGSGWEVHSRRCR